MISMEKDGEFKKIEKNMFQKNSYSIYNLLTTTMLLSDNAYFFCCYIVSFRTMTLKSKK